MAKGLFTLHLDVSKTMQYFEGYSKEQINEKGHKLLEEVALEAEKTAKALAPIDTGAFRDSIHLKWNNQLEVQLLDGVNYGVFLELGTRPHEIVPFNKKALRFEVDGKIVFSKRVFHPGNPPMHIFGRTKDIVERMLPSLVQKYFKNGGK